MWFVLHDADAGVSGWAARAVPGDRVALWGPRRSHEPPRHTTSQLLVADETGLGAVAAILDEADADQAIHVVLEAADADHLVDLPTGPHIMTEWLFRDGDRAGTGTRLLDAVRRLELDLAGLYAYGAAETHQISAVRAHLRSERGLAAQQVRMTGYWRRTAPGS